MTKSLNGTKRKKKKKKGSAEFPNEMWNFLLEKSRAPGNETNIYKLFWGKRKRESKDAI